VNEAVILDSREKGQFQISIATSLALEGLFGIHPDHEKSDAPPLALRFDEIWINVRTMFRNMVGSIKNETTKVINEYSYAMALLEECSLIKEQLDERTKGRLQPIFYACSHETLASHFPHASIKEAKTEKQRFYAALENETLTRLLKEAVAGQVSVFDVNIKANGKRTVMLTSYPLDLLVTSYTSELALLESHTGVLKLKNRWYTKLNNGRELTRIPFDRMTVQVFGDSAGTFSPYPKNYREALTSIAEKHQWTPLTTKDRILQTVKLSHEPILYATISQLY